jgi:hypothetical protein
VASRAQFRCEYCLLHEDDSFVARHVDHIVSRKHGGMSNPENLSYCCIRCNLWDLGSLSTLTGELIPFFNPRRQRWSDHFRLDGVMIEPLTAEGEVTATVLRLNLDKRIIERRLLINAGRYPAST